MRIRRPLDGELKLAVGFAVAAIAGWVIGSAPLAVVAVLGALSTWAMYLWYRYCLAGVDYRRQLSATRASFGEEVVLDTELVNDKLLPLAWLHLVDQVPSGLTITGAAVVKAGGPALADALVEVRPMLPYQRLRRHLVVSCTHRGEHVFGPARLRSGDPLALRERSREPAGRDRLLVYPKVFALAPSTVVSRVLVGERRARREPIEDPSLVAGVREYRPGDPLRKVDWRATARTATLLVRDFEPSVTLRVAVFLDFSPSVSSRYTLAGDELEFTIAVAASLVAELARRRIAVGLFSSGAVGALPLAFPVSTSPAALPAILEGLARANPYGRTTFAEVIAAEGSHLGRGTSALVVAGSWSAAALAALAELRRRHAVTAVAAGKEGADEPPRRVVDAVLHAVYEKGWQGREVLELGS